MPVLLLGCQEWNSSFYGVYENLKFLPFIFKKVILAKINFEKDTSIFIWNFQLFDWKRELENIGFII